MRSAPEPRQPTFPPEELGWLQPVVLHTESRPQDGGFLTRHHQDPRCRRRLDAAGLLAARPYDQVRAADLCAGCATGLVPSSTSTVVRRLRDHARTLDRLRALASTSEAGPMPREVVHVRALRFEACTAVSVHPEAPAATEAVVALADDVAGLLRAALLRYDHRRAATSLSRPGR